MIIALAAGFVIGFFIAIPPGPASMAMIGRGLEHGFKYGLMVGVGAAFSEACYAAIGFFGVELIKSTEIEYILRIIGIFLVLILGIRFTFYSKSYSNQKKVKLKKVQRRKSFILGYMISIATPTIGAAYIVVANLVHSYNIYESSNLNNTFATIGAGIGATVWMSLLMTLTWKVKQSVNSKVINYLVIGSGVVLLLFSLYMIISIFNDFTRS
jgi:threonine/homoserine/homoserine lactone efflux protein